MTLDKPQPCANQCGQIVSGYEDGIDCAECRKWLCDSCYDTSLGDGCYCHYKGVFYDASSVRTTRLPVELQGK